MCNDGVYVIISKHYHTIKDSLALISYFKSAVVGPNGYGAMLGCHAFMAPVPVVFEVGPFVYSWYAWIWYVYGRAHRPRRDRMLLRLILTGNVLPRVTKSVMIGMGTPIPIRSGANLQNFASAVTVHDWFRVE